jgi:drug/metabolite transporter (DMT)-like permease
LRIAHKCRESFSFVQACLIRHRTPVMSASSNQSISTHPLGRAFGCVAVTVFLWASAFPAIRVGLGGFGPAQLAALRFVMASLVLGLYLAWTRPPLPNRSDLPRVLFAGLLGIAGCNLLLNFGSRTVDAGTVSFVINTAPVFTALLGSIFLGERLRIWGWLGIAVSFAGVAVIATGRGDMAFGAGALLILAAAVCQASQFVLQKPLLTRYSALSVTACVLWAGSATLIPFLPGGVEAAIQAPPRAVVALIFLALGPAALAFVAWSFALSRLPVSRAVSFLYLIPPVSTFFAWMVLGEAPEWRAFAGGAIALAGVVLVNVAGRPSIKSS